MKLKYKYKCRKSDLRPLLYGAVFPVFTLWIMLSSPWTESLRTLRMLDCYLPMPLLAFLLLVTEFFLSLTFFFDLRADGDFCGVTAYNAKVLALAAAFLLIIWFCMEFCVISPLVSLLCVLASLCATLLLTWLLARRGSRLSFCCLAALIITAVLFVMNLNVLFI